MLRAWIGFYNVMTSYYAYVCLRRPKEAIKLLSGSDLLFAYAGELELTKRLGLTHGLNSAVGFAVAMYGPNILCKILCGIYMWHEASVYFLGKQNESYWNTSNDLIKNKIIMMTGLFVLTS